MKSKLLEKVWLTLAALGIGVSLFANNSNQLIESNAQTFSSAIVKKVNYEKTKQVLKLRKEHERLTPEQDSLLKDIEELN